jgi:hypothetical protein
MKQQVILLDVGGYTARLKALQDAHAHVIGITPDDKPCAGFTPIRVPDNWMKSDMSIPYPERCLHASGKLAIAAIHQLGIEADYYWVIESDCVASQSRWKALFASHAQNQTDGVFNCYRTRKETARNPRWTHQGTMPWADITHLNAIYRISRRGFEWILESAEETRECYGELVVGSVIKRAGGTLGRINLDQRNPHHTGQTMKAFEERIIVDRNLINHPVKANTYQP